MRFARAKAVVGVGLALVAVSAVAAVAWPTQTRLDEPRRLAAAARFHECLTVVTRPYPPLAQRWTRAAATGQVSCEHLGPTIDYAHFASRAALRQALRAYVPIGRYCQNGNRVVLDGLDSPKAFARFCTRLAGVLVQSPPAAHRPAPEDFHSGVVRAAQTRR